MQWGYRAKAIFTFIVNGYVSLKAIFISLAYLCRSFFLQKIHKCRSYQCLFCILSNGGISKREQLVVYRAYSTSRSRCCQREVSLMLCFTSYFVWLRDLVRMFRDTLASSVLRLPSHY